MRIFRCAIYTRKSSEEGLEQDFNSLHAQREACESYIKSQKHEGWELLPQEYDDGGFSGGDMNRPALKRLMEDIEKQKVDIIVVYKVDRLTRSLADFAKLVEIMDKQQISFVSITQQFNTTTSMGRLTLNVLLSFAQFEREVTGERIRDKIAMSKKKGKWMGGVPPIGYDVVDKKLVVNKAEAKDAKLIFEKYIELKSVKLLQMELQTLGIKTKSRVFKSGKISGGRYFSKGNLYNILSNRIFVGEIVHKENSYPGEHEAIIKTEIFDEAKRILQENRNKDLGSHNVKHSCVLSNKVFDDCGNIMTSKFSNSHKRMYRYYTSQAIIQGFHHMAGSLPNIPAEQLEILVRAELLKFLNDKHMLQPYFSKLGLESQNSLFEKAKSVLNGDVNQERLFMRYVICRVEVSSASITIEACAEQLVAALKDDYSNNIKKKSDIPIVIKRDIKLTPTSNGSKVIIGNVTSGRNSKLIKAIARSFLWNEQLVSGEVKNFREIGERENITHVSYISKILRLRFLAPDIIDMIMEGTQPIEWTAEKLFTIKELDWKKQRKQLQIS